MGSEKEDREGARAQVLLIREISINGDEHVKASCQRGEQRSVVQITPAQLGCMPDFVSREIARQAFWYTGVEKHPHRVIGQSGSSSRSLSEEGGLGRFENSDHVLARHRWEVHQKVVQGISALEVVEEGLDRNAGARKDRSASETLGCCRNQGIGKGHSFVLSGSNSTMTTFGGKQREQASPRIVV